MQKLEQAVEVLVKKLLYICILYPHIKSAHIKCAIKNCLAVNSLQGARKELFQGR